MPSYDYLTGLKTIKMKNIILLSLLLISYNLYSQCEGNCFDGYGTFSFTDGEVYEGNWIFGAELDRENILGQMGMYMK